MPEAFPNAPLSKDDLREIGLADILRLLVASFRRHRRAVFGAAGIVAVATVTVLLLRPTKWEQTVVVEPALSNLSAFERLSVVYPYNALIKETTEVLTNEINGPQFLQELKKTASSSQKPEPGSLWVKAKALNPETRPTSAPLGTIQVRCISSRKEYARNIIPSLQNLLNPRSGAVGAYLDTRITSTIAVGKTVGDPEEYDVYNRQRIRWYQRQINRRKNGQPTDVPFSREDADKGQEIIRSFGETKSLLQAENEYLAAELARLQALKSMGAPYRLSPQPLTLRRFSPWGAFLAGLAALLLTAIAAVFAFATWDALFPREQRSPVPY